MGCEISRASMKFLECLVSFAKTIFLEKVYHAAFFYSQNFASSNQSLALVEVMLRTDGIMTRFYKIAQHFPTPVVMAIKITLSPKSSVSKFARVKNHFLSISYTRFFITFCDLLTGDKELKNFI